MNEGRDLYGVTLLAPHGGFPLSPPEGSEAVVRALEVLSREREARQRDLLPRMARAFLRRLFRRPRAADQRANAVDMAEQEVRRLLATLPDGRRHAVLEYVRTCRTWSARLDSTINSRWSYADWDMTPAPKAKVSEPEQRLAHALEASGIHIQCQVGVAKEAGGARQGGWYGSYWLDCAYRDRSHLLRIDIELDGKHHYNRERQDKDERRNQVLADRGWYVLRLGGRILGQENQRLAIANLVELISAHRQAIHLATLDPKTIEDVLAAQADALSKVG